MSELLNFPNGNKANGEEKVSIMEPQTKKCMICGEELPIEQFLPIPMAKDGRHKFCDFCFEEAYPESEPIIKKESLKMSIAGMEYIPDSLDFWEYVFSDEIKPILSDMRFETGDFLPTSIDDTSNVFQRVINVLSEYGIVAQVYMEYKTVCISFAGSDDFDVFLRVIGMKEVTCTKSTEFSDFIDEEAFITVYNVKSPLEHGIPTTIDEVKYIIQPVTLHHNMEFCKSEFGRFLELFSEYFM